MHIEPPILGQKKAISYNVLRTGVSYSVSQEFSLITQPRVGTIVLNLYLNRIKRVDSLPYPRCGLPETAHHYFMHE